MMMRRMLFFLMIILIGSALHALDLHVDEIQPSRITLSWDRVPSALTYDLYLNGCYRATVRTPSYSIEHLTSHTSYSVRVQAQGQGTVIDEGTIEVTTSGWEGGIGGSIERKDNRGRTTVLDYRVSTSGAEYVIYGLYEGRWHECSPYRTTSDRRTVRIPRHSSRRDRLSVQRPTIQHPAITPVFGKSSS